MKQHKYILILTLTLIIISGCAEFRSKNRIDEGTIKYSIDFAENKKFKFKSSLLPNRMTIKFRNSNTSNKIEGLLGNMNLTFINKVKNNNCIILVNLWGKKLYFQDSLTNRDIPNIYVGMPQITIEQTKEIVHYKGYECKKAIAHYRDSLDCSFEILYTNDIDIVNPNINTPFESIDGVMLKFSIILQKHIMNISATAIMKDDISMTEFSVPTDYEKVPKRTIDDLISLMQ